MSHRRTRERGFSLILAALSFFVMLGMLGLALDMGRMFILKSELQAYVDAAALSGAARLDGTSAGVAAAEAVAKTGPSGPPNSVNFATTALSAANVTTGYAASPTATPAAYATAVSPASNSYGFVSVTATYPLTMYFLPVLGAFNGTWGISTSYNVSAVAMAGQRVGAAGPTNVVPLSPDAHDASAMDFGFEVGSRYTLKWGNGNVTGCPGDATFTPDNEPPNHGFVDLGWGNNSNAQVQAAIENSNCPLCPIAAGTMLDAITGNRGNSILSEFSDRSAQDPAQDSSYTAYLANPSRNNRRIILAPVNDPARREVGPGNHAAYYIAGFGAFLIDSQASLDTSSPSGWICATYLGPANKYAGGSAGSDSTKVYTLGLYK